MQITEAIETYLGLPMIEGREKKRMFGSIKDKIWSKLYSYQKKLFSQAGKEGLLKVVIQDMSAYLMSCFKIPEGLCEEIEGLLARFW